MEPLCSLDLEVYFAPIGPVRAGMRIDVSFTGTAVSSHWDGERSVSGVDYVTIGADGSMELNIRGQIRSGKEVISYSAVGRDAGKGDKAGPRELFTFDTAVEEFAWLNNEVAVGFGQMDGTNLKLEIYVLEP